MADPRSLPSAEAGARLGERELDQQMTDHGWLAVIVGICLALTGPTTPSFTLFTYLPAWPTAYGALLALTGAALLTCRWRGVSLWLGQRALITLAVTYGLGGAVLVATWGIWRFGSHAGSEPLLTAVPVLLFLALRCGRIIAVNRLRKTHDLGPSCRT